MSTSAIQSPIIIGCDHAAYPLKEKVKAHLIKKTIDVEDVGTDSEIDSTNGHPAWASRKHPRPARPPHVVSDLGGIELRAGPHEGVVEHEACLPSLEGEAGLVLGGRALGLQLVGRGVIPVGRSVVDGTCCFLHPQW